ncbi:MAG: dimethylsulfoxide reductase subunit B [Myxococcota bacterium]|jgi:anaerobic dimethyl sulfoxide reductase subunit B (iron-sulfur subunit)|nr:dimethylsulfoxide reductase subunit B [Myxococcota bacterium]
MMLKKGFRFDARSCSGCKTCQVACKDKQGHGMTTRFRRVYEISGGAWVQQGASWHQNVFAYHLSMSCNHCDKPICVEVCPSRAMRQNEDGIVTVDENRCLGCGYCAFACPYGAPLLDLSSGVMTKCDLCADLLREGKSPTCVAACPMRALELEDVEDLRQTLGRGAVFPFLQPTLTEPNWYVALHPDSDRAADGQARIANREEVEPK